MKILLIGKTGQLGGSLLRLNDGHTVIAPSRSVIDLDDPGSVERSVAEYQPDVLINTAAYHNVPECEVHPDRAFAVNCVAVRHLAETCRKKDILLVTFSSDYVFGGEQRSPYAEDARPNPLQMYGISRLAGELAARNTAPGHSVVIRTCGLYGHDGARSKGGSFVDKRIQDAQASSHLEMGCDQVVSPTYTDDLARAVLQLVAMPDLEPGVFHLVNEGECSWYEFTRAIYDLLEIDVVLKPVDRQGRSGDMRRPLYSVLGNNRARQAGVVMPHWKNALQRYLEDMRAAPVSTA